MKLLKKGLFFCLGGAGYVALEYLWRGRSHASMFVAGGACFVLLGHLRQRFGRLSLPLRGLLGAGIITGVELVTGLLVNRSYAVWDYRDMPLNFLGQICLPFTLLWIPLSIGAQSLYALLSRVKKKSPSV